MNLEPLAFKEVTPYEGKNAYPMWSADGRIYFVTDRWGRQVVSLWIARAHSPAKKSNGAATRADAQEPAARLAA